MKLHRNPMVSAIASILACSLLVACGGGGVVRSSPPPVSVPPASTPPPPAPAVSSPCPVPVTGDCVVAAAGLMLNGYNSGYALTVRTGNDSLGLVGSTVRFDGGTRVESGRLSVGTGSSGNTAYYNPSTILQSNVTVLEPGSLAVVGIVDGNVDNRGSMVLYGTVRGSLVNQGRLGVSAARYDSDPLVIRSDFTQTSTATLLFELAPAGWDSPAWLEIDGRATLGGNLMLQQYADAWGPYPLPGVGAHRILHATGGVSGTFDRWTSPGLFIDGSLRYGSNDVWFDLTRISLQAAMAGQGFGGITLASAGHLDRALAIADGYAQLPGSLLTTDQQRFLATAANLLWQDDARHAARGLDSLAGHGHAQFAHAQQALANETGTAIARRAMRLHAGDGGRWSDALSYRGAAAQSEGYDHWLGPRLLVGGNVSQGEDALAFAQLGGQASGRDRLASLYLHHRGDRWQATAVGMAGRSQRLLQRPIELDDGRVHLATSLRQLSLAAVHGELARPMRLAGGSLQPFVSLDYSAMRSARFHEAGDTGFEMVAPDAVLQRLDAGLGARYAREWRLGNGMLGLHADWQVQRALAASGAMPAAFAGVPGVLFDLAALDAPGTRHIARVGLDGGFGHGWRCGLQGVRSDDSRNPQAWQLRFSRVF